ncbi:MAG: hypothetical protein M9933_18725 [Chitinophagaceae bacterium]|nr:hypothetical protein [Chitinophagaceae bacterium]
MNSQEIEQNVKRIIENFSKENFLYDLLLAYGISKTSITRLKSGDFNLSKVEGEILYKKKIFFKQQPTDKLLSAIENLAKEERIVKHSPRFAVVTDYKNLVAKDLKLGKNLDISIKDLPNHYAFFLPLAGSEVYHSTNDNEADRNAAYKMAQLYDLLITQNPNVYNSKESIHNLNIFLSRLLFCFFAEDTEIFDGDSIFTNTLYQHTNGNGSDTHLFLDRLFDVLNTDKSKRKNVPDHLGKFEYVNGGLFKDPIESPKFNAKARKILTELGDLNWKDINPDIFGSMIQAVVIPEYRSDLGMHYTSVPNIQKLIKPLFLDALYEEFENSKTIPQLRKLINRIAKIKFFDPACGSGNFLIITYKEIRLLEIKILQRIIDLSPTPAMEFTSIQLSQFYGIELDDFAHEMAILSLWLAEHQMNKVFEEMLFDYGKSKPILPLKQAGKIVQGNSARVDWKSVCPIEKDDEVYIIGNPPYLGSFLQSKEQKEDLAITCRGFKSYKDLDYIAIWFIKASAFIQDCNSKFAFVTTNSLCQGEQVGLLWPHIFNKKLEIFFAYKSFKWTNNAKGNAGVYCTIIGVANTSDCTKKLYDENVYTFTKSINPYLTSGSTVIISKRTKPISTIPLMNYGSKIVDNGHLIFTSEEKQNLIRECPKAINFFKKLAGSAEFIRGLERWILYIQDDDLQFAKNIPEVSKRLNLVTEFRKKSTEGSTREMAKYPNRFYYSVHDNSDSIIIPRTSSVRRNYIPMGFLNGDTIVSDAASVIFNAQAWIFGVLTSHFHMTWVKAVGGRLKTDYRYSSQLCYNNFPFPEITLKQKENLNLYVLAILDERAKHPEKTMAQLYDPDKMPKSLKQAHEELDRAVEQCYRLQPFTSDTERLEYLFKLYEEMTKSGTLFEKQKKTRKTTAKKKN